MALAVAAWDESSGSTAGTVEAIGEGTTSISVAIKENRHQNVDTTHHSGGIEYVLVNGIR